MPKRVFFCLLWAFGFILLRFRRKIDEVSLPQKLMGPADLQTVCVSQSNAVSLIHTSFLFDSWCIVINLVRHLGINVFLSMIEGNWMFDKNIFIYRRSNLPSKSLVLLFNVSKYINLSWKCIVQVCESSSDPRIWQLGHK